MQVTRDRNIKSEDGRQTNKPAQSTRRRGDDSVAHGSLDIKCHRAKPAQRSSSMTMHPEVFRKMKKRRRSDNHTHDWGNGPGWRRLHLDELEGVAILPMAATNPAPDAIGLVV